MQTIYLIGTWHRFQVSTTAIIKDNDPYVSAKDIDNFREFLFDAARSISSGAIGEEMSSSRVQEFQGGASVTKEVAEALGIRHEFCDPDREERKALGLATAAELQHDERSGFPRRETFWLKRIWPLLARAPVIFVCGSNHIESFGARLKDNGVTTRVLCCEWLPDGYIDRLKQNALC
jgi:hypothetical protein